MTTLTFVLLIKILVSIVTLVIPFLFFPPARLDASMGMTAHSPRLYRLYGMAISALLVGYAGGIVMAQTGQMPWAIIAMGIVSNIGAAGLLLTAGVKGLERLLMGVFAMIGVALLLAAALPELALHSLL